MVAISHLSVVPLQPEEADIVDTDEALIQRLRSGDRQAMAAIYHDQSRAIYNYCYRRTGSWQVAEDLAATTFLELWRNREQTRAVQGQLRPWLYGIATNVIRAHHRSSQRDRSLLNRVAQQAHHSPAAAEVADQVEATALFQTTLDALGAMPEPDQEVFALIFWEQLSYDEVAQALNIPIGTVRSRLSRVRRHLRAAYPKEA